MMFNEKISQIKKLLGQGRFKDKTLLACAIYLKIKFNLSFRKVPLQDVPFTWFNLRYWFQRLQKLGLLNQIQNIVGGD